MDTGSWMNAGECLPWMMSKAVIRSLAIAFDGCHFQPSAPGLADAGFAARADVVGCASPTYIVRTSDGLPSERLRTSYSTFRSALSALRR
jgi:hypothetical protein